MNAYHFSPGQPYVFVSYQHKDKEAVEKTIVELQNRYGLNIWYDAQMYAGVNWTITASQYIRDPLCKAILFFASEEALTSLQVELELKKAMMYRKKIIPINFTDASFDDTLMIINSKLNWVDPIRVNTAERIVSEYLDSRLKYIVLELGNDAFYSDIYRALQKNTEGLIMEKIQNLPAPSGDSEKSEMSVKISIDEDTKEKMQLYPFVNDIVNNLYSFSYSLREWMLEFLEGETGIDLMISVNYLKRTDKTMILNDDGTPQFVPRVDVVLGSERVFMLAERGVSEELFFEHIFVMKMDKALQNSKFIAADRDIAKSEANNLSKAVTAYVYDIGLVRS